MTNKIDKRVIPTKSRLVAENASRYTNTSAISHDGTTIGYRQLGHGPGIVMVHGAMSSGYYHLELAEALSDAFTVYLLDRRGRGLSGPYRTNHDVRTDIADLSAVLDKTDARYVFAVSVGAVIALEAARTLPNIRKLALYEPLLFPDRASASVLMDRFDREMTAGKVVSALATAMKGAHMGPPLMNALPHWLVAAMTRGLANWTPPGEYVAFKDIAPTLHYEGQVIAEASGEQERVKDVHAEVLLLGGSKSSAFLKNALTRLEAILPNATRVELASLNHASSWNKAVRGNPVPVARALRQFFSTPPR